MSETLLSVGNIIYDKKNATKYRIIAIVCGNITLCEMQITKFNLIQIDVVSILDLIKLDELTIMHDERIVFDINELSDSVKNKYLEKKEIINEVLTFSDPTFMNLMGKKNKKSIQDIIINHNLIKSSFWRMCTAFFQSGMQDYSLVDKKALNINKKKTYKYKAKPGMKPEYYANTGVILTPEIIKYFDEALNEYKSGRQKTIESAYNKMNNLHFTRIELVNGVTSLVLLPESQRPTKRQFYYYVKKHLSEQEKDLIKTSAAEQRNNKRLLLSDSLNGVNGPGDMVEIDACEADVSLVSVNDSNVTVGRPIVYFMIDVYTRMILAVSVTFDNNSVLGITNLFLNLVDDKKEYCNRYGMGFDDDRLWRSNIIPRRLRVDRGSEFKSKEFDRICNELGIEKQIVTGASGSLKGVVEQSFHQMHSNQNMHLEDRGLIEKRYDSQHHKEATLNIHEYTKMIINFVLTHNQRYLDNYPLTRDMIDNKIDAIPSILWDYGVKKYGNPRPIPSIEQYLFNLMTPIKAKISRRGISYKNLWYFPNGDPYVKRQMFDAGNKKLPFEARMDTRDVGNIYYIRDNKLIKAPLNELIAGNADYNGLTMKEYEEYYKAHKSMNAKGRVHNEELSAFSYAVNQSIVSDAAKESYSDKKNMRVNRELEKQMISSGGRIETRLEDMKAKAVITDNNDGVEDNAEGNNAGSEKLHTFSSFEEALSIFDEL